MSTNNSANISSQTGSPIGTYLENVSWTPTVFGTTSTGTGTYTTQKGCYTRIGNLIHFIGKVIWTAHTGTGRLRLTLPLNVRIETDYKPIGLFASADLNFPAASTYVVCFFEGGTTTANPNIVRDNNSFNQIDMQGSGNIHYSGSYLI